MSIAEKIRKSREIEVKVGDITFTGVRATFDEYAKYVNNSVYNGDVCKLHITGWSGVKESDILDDGTDKVMPFDKETFDEIIVDKPEWSGEIVKVLFDRARNGAAARTENEKK